MLKSHSCKIIFHLFDSFTTFRLILANCHRVLRCLSCVKLWRDDVWRMRTDFLLILAVISDTELSIAVTGLKCDSQKLRIFTLWCIFSSLAQQYFFSVNTASPSHFHERNRNLIFLLLSTCLAHQGDLKLKSLSHSSLKFFLDMHIFLNTVQLFSAWQASSNLMSHETWGINQRIRNDRRDTEVSEIIHWWNISWQILCESLEPSRTSRKKTSLKEDTAWLFDMYVTCM